MADEPLIDRLNGIFGNLIVNIDNSPRMYASKIIIIPGIRDVAERKTRFIDDFEIKGYALFDWFMHKTDYERGNGNYRDSVDQRNKNWKRYGNCLELAFLYVAMARSIGMESNIADVKIDTFGRKVDHACASIHNNGKIILSDPAYHTFDVKHRYSQIYDQKNNGILELRIEEKNGF